MAKFKRIALAVCLLLGGLLSSALYLKEFLVIKEVRIHFPLSFLKTGPELLDPDNTETIWEYYLLENLSCGLVRDSARSVTGYEGCLSDSFYQRNDTTWVFHLRELRWSDGSVVSSFEITKWIEAIASRDSRHLKFLKLIAEVKFDENSRNLEMFFSAPVDSGILHELSLADAALFPTDFKTRGWNKTIGPYMVEAWDAAIPELKLVANKYSPLYSESMPLRATLFFVKDISQREKLFTEYHADIVPHTATGDPNLAKAFRKTADQEYVGHPTHIAFFFFNRGNELAKDLDSRVAFGKVIHEFQDAIKEEISVKYGWNIESQMVPQGFHGRLSEQKENPIAGEVLQHLAKSLTVTLPENYRAFPDFCDQLQKAFSRHGIALRIEFQTSISADSRIFAQVYTFVGNQLDASGSWAFLTSDGGALKPWLSEFQNLHDGVFSSLKRSDQEQATLELHKAVLAKVIAVPLTVSSIRYFLSDSVDIGRWNKFDARLRIYEIR